MKTGNSIVDEKLCVGLIFDDKKGINSLFKMMMK